MRYSKCHSCNGTKKIRGMGYIEQECPICSGIGFLDLEEEDQKKEKNDSTTSLSPVKENKKRGRPKKEN